MNNMNILRRKVEIIIRVLFNRNCILVTYELEPKESTHVIVSTKHKLYVDVQSLKSATKYLESNNEYVEPEGHHIPMTSFHSDICTICGKTVSEHFI